MRGGMLPMSVNEQVIRPLISNVSVIGLFLIPMITMRLFAEEKRSGMIELLVTSPGRDFEVILGKWLAAMLLYSGMLLLTALNFAWLFRYGNPDWKPVARDLKTNTRTICFVEGSGEQRTPDYGHSAQRVLAHERAPG